MPSRAARIWRLVPSHATFARLDGLGLRDDLAYGLCEAGPASSAAHTDLSENDLAALVQAASRLGVAGARDNEAMQR